MRRIAALLLLMASAASAGERFSSTTRAGATPSPPTASPSDVKVRVPTARCARSTRNTRPASGSTHVMLHQRITTVSAARHTATPSPS